MLAPAGSSSATCDHNVFMFPLLVEMLVLLGNGIETFNIKAYMSTMTRVSCI